MAKYLFEAFYSPEGAKGVIKEGPSSRKAAVEKAAASVGGRIESFYFAFGDVDAYVIADLPDNEAAAAIALSVNQSGGAKVRTIVLMTVEQADAAAKKTVGYRAPGK